VFRGMMIHRKAWGFHAPSWFFGPRLKVGTTIIDPPIHLTFRSGYGIIA